ncbi:MAG: carboxypeptidase-like regulatory domain-containing protein [Bacteroidota bacterium]
MTKALHKISEYYQVFFSYDSREVGDRRVDFSMVPGESVRSAVERLLTPLDFSYEQFNDDYFVIYQNVSQKIVAAKSTFQPRKDNNSFSAILLDEETKGPIDNAFIFFRNSTISTISDFSGFFQLEAGELGKVELVITHLNYETQSYVVDESLHLPNTV